LAGAFFQDGLNVGFVFLEVFQATLRDEAAALFDEGFPAFPAGVAE